MKNFGMNLLYAIAIAATVAIIFFMFTLMLSILALALAGALLWWGMGQKITVKQDGKQIGTIRWFTFTPTR